MNLLLNLYLILKLDLFQQDLKFFLRSEERRVGKECRL